MLSLVCRKRGVPARTQQPSSEEEKKKLKRDKRKESRHKNFICNPKILNPPRDESREWLRHPCRQSTPLGRRRLPLPAAMYYENWRGTPYACSKKWKSTKMEISENFTGRRHPISPQKEGAARVKNACCGSRPGKKKIKKERGARGGRHTVSEAERRRTKKPWVSEASRARDSVRGRGVPRRGGKPVLPPVLASSPFASLARSSPRSAREL